MSNEPQTLSCRHNSYDLVTPGDLSGDSVSGPTFGANNLRGLRSAPCRRVEGPVLFLGGGRDGSKAHD